jgi:hypothetical protein
MHVQVHVDAQGRQVAARCAARTLVLERYPLELRAWAEAAGRLVAGAGAGRSVSTSCAPPASGDAARVTFPREGQIFSLDPDGPERQELALTASSSAASLRFIVDGRPGPLLHAPFRWPWRLTPGAHSVAIDAGGERSEAVRFEVRSADSEPR